MKFSQIAFCLDSGFVPWLIMRMCSHSLDRYLVKR